MGVFVGDVSNHGVSAALFLSLVKATTDRICREYAHSPFGYISNLNRELTGNMPLSFLTAIYGVFRKKADEPGIDFTFSCAGHPPPLLYRAESGTVEFLYSKGTLIGMFDDLKLEETTVRLFRGDRIYLYTDGVPETVNDRNQIWGFENMPDLVLKAHDRLLSLTLDNIMAEIDRFRGDIPLSDDIIIVGFEGIHD